MTFSVNRRFDVLFGSIHFTDHAEFHSLQGVEIKIGEKFRPPKKVKYEKILFLNLFLSIIFSLSKVLNSSLFIMYNRWLCF